MIYLTGPPETVATRNFSKLLLSYSYLLVYLMVNLNQWLVSALIIQIHEDTVFLSMPPPALNFYFNSMLRSKVLGLLMKGPFNIGSGQCQSKRPS